METNPWYKTTLSLNIYGSLLKFSVPHDVFSTLQIDEGTLLLLDHLPPASPNTVLEIGCGYGALGLPVALRYKDAQIEMVDRDLLAVAWAKQNADLNRLSNANIYGSLGYRDLLNQNTKYDWILCNVPARIGKPFMEHLLGVGQTKLTELGEMRVVIIRDLIPLFEELRNQHAWSLAEVAKGPRHSVFSLKRNPNNSFIYSNNFDLYFRDTVEISGLKLDRPFDLGGDDPKRLTTSLPVLLDALPRQAPKRVLCFRCAYGALPLVSLTRWPNAQVIAVDRDLLATTFTKRNVNGNIDIRAADFFPNAILPNEKFDLIVGELSSSAGEKVAHSEIQAISKMLEKGGQALLLVSEKQERQWINPLMKDPGAIGQTSISIAKIVSRQGYSIFRLSGK